MNAGKVNFGLLLIIVGIAVFAVNIEAMHWSVFLNLLRFWPVIFIAVGLQMILKRIYAPTAYLSCFLVAAVGFWVLYDSYTVYGIEGDESIASLPISDLGDGVTRIAVQIDVDDADLSVSSSNTELVRCYYDEPLGSPIIVAETEGDVARISIRDRGFSGWGFFDSYDVLSDWSLKLYKALPIDLMVDCQDSDVLLRLTDFKLSNLECDTRYSSVDIRFGSLVPEVAASIRMSRAEFRVRIPDSAGVEILRAEDFGDFYVGEIDFVAEGGRLVTPNFEAAPVKVRLDIDGTARIFRITH